ncbi:adenylate kinase and related kinase [Paenibacillus melissococcoides]|uniref:Adenylate kinase and related kinase n=1 Tax=Paenibacillus melissococcoides TaxID=2912268 RepID=A0ABM9FZN8_9BACL|nr:MULTISPECIES: adenylate kinase and related kinase [Paenibacillus]MEB9892032.1 adenylate kinase and related kinase [Bacillus cereus]CAH8244650.1 adenylate kinase and related kinase [Paenibacillus melissococcoides]CAH8708606.1 adenylate kinase and related kinase [Paenibacillus melissococcoides]CAH8709323.1 adenylate kinase and related kinase [Paenibacillus melissococcoides]GIO77407.1 hypothetical protein J6TS7_10170 [Paenibacillus dendritiformis]
MNRQLMKDTIQMLEQELPPLAGIRITAGSDERYLSDMARTLDAYDMTAQERRVLLGCYWLLRQAMRTHHHVPQDKRLAGKAVLDGDFLLSLYYQFAARHGLTELIADMATVNKRIQIRRAEGKGTDSELHRQMSRFLMKRYKQVAYEVI